MGKKFANFTNKKQSLKSIFYKKGAKKVRCTKFPEDLPNAHAIKYLVSTWASLVEIFYKKWTLVFSLIKTMLRHQIIICVPQRKLRFVTIFLFFPFRLSRGVKAVIHAACGKCSLKTSIEEKKKKVAGKKDLC